MLNFIAKESNAKNIFALLNSPRLSAKENMRIDKALFDGFKQSNLPIFRVYEWEASYTYGLSQNIENLQKLENLKQFKENHAKRMTGGGILFHGNDISYSLIIPTSYVKNLSVKDSYELICRFLLRFYESLGLNPSYAKDIKSIELSKNEYCQRGYEPYDILVDGKKIGGNAQRRSKDVIFQHGSISVDNSSYSMGATLLDLGINISFKEAKELLINAFETTFDVVFEQQNREELYAS